MTDFDVEYRLPDQALFGSPVYIHSHSYTFYTQLAYHSASQNKAIQQTRAVQDGVVQILRQNIGKLDSAHEDFKRAGIDLDLIEFNNSFLELKQIKAESLRQNTISHVISKYRKLMQAKLIETLDKWLDGEAIDGLADEIAQFLVEELGTQMEKTDFTETTDGKTISTKRLRSYLKSLTTRMKHGSKDKQYIIEKVVKKFFNKTTLMNIGVISELEKIPSQQRAQDITAYKQNLVSIFSDPIWTTDNIQEKITTIEKAYNSSVAQSDGNIFIKGMPHLVGSLIGHMFELDLVQELRKHGKDKLHIAETSDGFETGPKADIVPQVMQGATQNITSDVDLGIILSEAGKLTYGISAKTSIGGMEFKSSTSAFGDVDDSTWKFIFYILINYYALRNYDASGISIRSSMFGTNIVDSIMQAIFIVEAAGKLLGNVFIETGKNGRKTLAQIIEERETVSMPMLLAFPNKTIYTVTLLENIFNEFNKQAQGVFNTKFPIDAKKLESNWVIKQTLLKLYADDPDPNEGYFYDQLYKASGGWLINPENPLEGNWFTFAYTYNEQWLTK